MLIRMQSPKSIATIMMLAVLVAAPSFAQTLSAQEQRKALLARAKAAELPGTWTPAPVTKLSHAAATYAQRVCSAVFIAGMSPAFAGATQGDGNPLAPLVERVQLGAPVVDAKRQEVRVALPDGGVRVARRYGSQGCVILPEGSDAIAFQPSVVEPRGVATEPAARLPLDALDTAKLTAAIAAAFEPDDAFTQAFVVTWKGQVIGERYALGAGPQTPLEGWSMGKSVVATLLGTLLHRGVYTLDAPAPIPEWQQPGDPRAAIRIRDILQMASGLRIRAEQDPEWVDDGQLADHWYYYSAPDAFAYAASRQLQWPPGTIGRYRNTDPVLGSYLVRLGAAKLGADYHSYPQRALFDPLGIRTATLETDASGNFLTQGAELMSARDWARLGNLYLQDGVWNGQRLLPEGFVDFVRTPAPAWVADGRSIYGGLFWLAGDGALNLPADAYFMAGAGEQYTIIIPSHDLVVTRLGRFAGRRPATTALNKALDLLLQAVPSNP
jgi:CubicO group peptidase (beta-lactamase class C family)